MFEWEAVFIAGAVGGFLGSVFLRIGGDVSWPAPVSEFFESHSVTSFLSHVFRSTLLGGVASWLLWALYNPSANFSSLSFSAVQLATAGLIGAGGVSAVDRLIRERQGRETIQEQADTIIEMGRDLLARDEEPNGEDQS